MGGKIFGSDLKRYELSVLNWYKDKRKALRTLANRITPTLMR